MAAHVIEMAMSPQDIPDVCWVEAELADMLDTRLHIGPEKRVDEYESLARDQKVAGRPLNTHVIEVVEDLKRPNTPLERIVVVRVNRILGNVAEVSQHQIRKCFDRVLGQDGLRVAQAKKYGYEGSGRAEGVAHQGSVVIHGVGQAVAFGPTIREDSPIQSTSAIEG